MEVEDYILKYKGRPNFFGTWVDKYYHQIYLVQNIEGDIFCSDFKDCEGTSRKLYLVNHPEWASVESYVRGIHMEQDELSPHFYFSDRVLEKAKNGTILDIGAAEGNFTLSLIDRIKRAYLFEPDSNWNKALNMTFADCLDKVTVVNSFVSEKSDGDKTISIDEYFGENIPTDISVIKLDIEGFEQKALLGMRRTLSQNPDAVLLVCAYHTQNAEREIRELLSDYDIIARPGKMLFYDETYSYPYFRTGVLEAIREQTV